MSAPATELHVFGIRHHGPGSARSLLAALKGLKPDCILIEGPPDGAEALPLAAHEKMEPPVALLVYAPDEPRRAVFYPYAVFSPEWQAIRWGLVNSVPVRFMDLPVAHRFGLDKEAEARAKAEAEAEAGAKAAQVEGGGMAEGCGEEAVEPEPEPKPKPKQPHPRQDPLRWLAEAAGYNDGERWWEHLVESRRDSRDLFAAILEAMTALRKELPPLEDPDEAREEVLREAHMRAVIRGAAREGAARIAVVCGAWHAPVLAGCLAGRREADAGLPAPSARDDAAALKGLPRTKVAATWIPWTYGRLAAESGYGAGVISPGWYHHLWTHPTRLSERWLTRVAKLLRKEDLDASAAQTIEAVRLTEALAAIRGRPLPGLEELNEACRTVFCFGSSLPLGIIRERLIIGEELGRIPETAPTVPLQQDLAREQKRLRLPPKALAESKELDLREANDLDRSRLLHRLDLLSLPWGSTERARGKGTFKEIWRLEWKPEFAIALIDASRWGNTVSEAASARVCDLAGRAPDLPALTGLIDGVLLADLPEAAAHVMRKLQDQAAVTSDVAHLMDALPPLAGVLRYGNVRRTDTELIGQVVSGLVARICIGLVPACGSLNDEAAAGMHERIGRVHEAMVLLQSRDYAASWQATLARLAGVPNVHGLIAGRCVRLLLDARALAAGEAGSRLSLALSTANEPAQAAAWIEGFLKDSGAILIHDDGLWALLDEWVGGLKPDAFVQVLPLLRRTFGTFAAAERRMMGERARQGGRPPALAGAAAAAGELDAARAEAVLPLVRSLLGLEAGDGR